MDRSTPQGRPTEDEIGEPAPDSGGGKPAKKKRDREAEGLRGVKVNPEPRRTEVEMLLLTQMHHAKVARTIAGKWGVDERTVWNDIRVVLARLRKAYSAKTPLERRNELLASWGDLYGRSLAAKDFRAAAKALESITKMEGAFAPTEVRVDVSSMPGAHVDLRIIDPNALDDYERALERLLAPPDEPPPGVDPATIIDVSCEPTPTP